MLLPDGTRMWLPFGAVGKVYNKPHLVRDTELKNVGLAVRPLLESMKVSLSLYLIMLFFHVCVPSNYSV